MNSIERVEKSSTEEKKKYRTRGYFKYFLIGWIWNICINIAINGAFGFIFATSVMPIWGNPSILYDFLQMCLYLGFLLSWFVILGVHNDVILGKIDYLSGDIENIPIISKLPRNSILRALIFMSLTFSIFFPLAILTLYMFQVESLPYWNFVYYKAFYGGFMAAVIEPIVRLSSLIKPTNDYMIRLLEAKPKKKKKEKAKINI